MPLISIRKSERGDREADPSADTGGSAERPVHLEPLLEQREGRRGGK